MMRLAPVFLSAGLLLSACDDIEADSEEIGRVLSPDGRVEAVLSEGSIDATTPSTHRLYIVGAGASTVGQEPLLVGDHFRNLAIAWRGDRFLDLLYSTGRIFEFQNFWQSSEIDDWTYIVEIRLNPPADDVSLGISQ